MYFPVTSRYHTIEIAKWLSRDDREVPYLRRRFIPITKGAAVQVEHSVTQDERLDNITARYLGDPEQFWQLCDVNNAMQPDELTSRVGRRLRIPMFEGF
jgi:hypothetical protein